MSKPISFAETMEGQAWGEILHSWGLTPSDWFSLPYWERRYLASWYVSWKNRTRSRSQAQGQGLGAHTQAQNLNPLGQGQLPSRTRGI